jgi:hypothetical protein
MRKKKMNKIIEIKNAVITGTSLSIERGVLTGFVDLDYGGSGQGFGGHVLYSSEYRCKEDEEYVSRPFAGHFIQRVLEIAEVDEWEKLKGRPVRVKGEPWGRLDAIGHFLKDEWFDIDEEFRVIKNEPEGVQNVGLSNS